MHTTFDGMASKGLRVISYQGTRKVEAGFSPSHTTETLIGYTVCWRFVAFIPIKSFNHLLLDMLKSYIPPYRVNKQKVTFVSLIYQINSLDNQSRNLYFYPLAKI